MIYQVAVKNGDVVVFTATIENSSTASDAAERALKLCQAMYSSVEVYDAFDDSEDAPPLLKKIARP